MIELLEVQLAMRARAETLVVATTGDSTDLGITAEGFIQTGDSFVTQRFYRGMEIVATGSRVDCNNGVHIVRDVEPGLLTIVGGLTPERRIGATRSITSGLPLLRSWEGEAFDSKIGRPQVAEQFVPATGQLITSSSARMLPGAPRGMMRHRGLYILNWFALTNDSQGIHAGRYAGDKLSQLFAPGTPFSLSSGDLRVRNDVAPIPAQIIPQGNGRSAFAFTVQWEAYSRNVVAA